MTSNTPFIRQVELLVGPLSEDAGGGSTSDALRIFSDGSRNGLRVKFSIKKTLTGAPNASVIEVMNLKRESMERIRASLAKVRLSVGWKNTGLSLLASGGILSSLTEKDGTDSATKMQVLDGYGGQVKGVTNKTFGGNSSISDVVKELAQSMPGVNIGDIDVDGLIGSGGLSISDRSADALDKIASQYGFSWSVQDGTFQAIQDTRTFNRVSEISTRSRNLIRAVPILSGPMQIESGVEITAVMDSRVSPGNQVKLESAVNPNLNGIYKIHEVDFEGDTMDNNWIMKIRSFKII